MIHDIVCLRNCRGARFNYYAGDHYTCEPSLGNAQLYGIKDDSGTFSGFMSLDFIQRHFNIEDMTVVSDLDILFNKYMDRYLETSISI